MALYVYVKALPRAESTVVRERIAIASTIRFLPYLSIMGGLVLLAAILLPILSYRMMVFSKNTTKLITPLSDRALAEARGFINPLAPAVLSAQDNKEQAQPEMNSEVDYNLISNWFPTASFPGLQTSKITNYTISIPKLKISDAMVTIGGVKIKENLIQYPSTALPGEYGNTVIFGHSVLPMFYNPKNYESIFSLLPTLEKGDKVYIYFDGIEYAYQVEDYFEVKPEEVQVLEQRFNEQILSLITCVPPGTYSRRGVIRARLIKI
jgi:sortase A